jgi:hypothetical protein
MYKWIRTNMLLQRLDDGACIPWPPAEREGYKAQAWIDLGNTPAAADPPPPPPTADELEALCQSLLSGNDVPISLAKVLKAKMVSDLAFRLGVAPGALTAAQLTAERNRIASIYKAL